MITLITDIEEPQTKEALSVFQGGLHKTEAVFRLVQRFVEATSLIRL
jgi:hypothetical protein